MLAAGAILFWTGLGIIAGLAVYGGVKLFDSFEAFVAGQFAEDALGHRPDPYGDIPALPNDLKILGGVGLHRSGDMR